MNARREAKEALAKQEVLLASKEADLAYYNECLKTFKNAASALGEDDPVELGIMMKDLILRHTIRVQNLEKEIISIKVNISDIRRELEGKFSLAPAIR